MGWKKKRIEGRKSGSVLRGGREGLWQSEEKG